MWHWAAIICFETHKLFSSGMKLTQNNILTKTTPARHRMFNRFFSTSIPRFFYFIFFFLFRVDKRYQIEST